MGFIVTKGLTEDVFAGKYIYLDNDFLSVLFNDFDALTDLFKLTHKGTLLIDPLIKFEFLQTVFLPEQRALKEEFISNDVFIPAMEHQSIFSQISTNAYTLSYLYGHNKCTTASVVDLFLAARSVLNTPNSIIITGNRKDFPDFIFDMLGVFNREEHDGTVRAFSAVTFNKSKYNDAVSKWTKLQTTSKTKVT